MKTIVDIEYVRWLKAELAAFNALDLSEVLLREDGKDLIVAETVIDDWKYVGLNNADFIMDDVYKLKTLGLD